MRGISEIIATVLMLMIVVGLAGTAYVYIQGSLTQRAQTTIDILDVSCNTNVNPAEVDVILKNFDPRLSIDNLNTSLVVKWDNTPVPTSLTLNGWQPAYVGAGNVSIGNFTCTPFANCVAGSPHTLRIVGPGNAVEKPTSC